MKTELVKRIMQVFSCEKTYAEELAHEQITRLKWRNPALNEQKAIHVLLNTL